MRYKEVHIQSFIEEHSPPLKYFFPAPSSLFWQLTPYMQHFLTLSICPFPFPPYPPLINWTEVLTECLQENNNRKNYVGLLCPHSYKLLYYVLTFTRPSQAVCAHLDTVWIMCTTHAHNNKSTYTDGDFVEFRGYKTKF